MKQVQEEELKNFYSIGEVAARLGMEKQFVRTLIFSGQLPSYRFGRIYRIKTEDLENYMLGQRHEGPVEPNPYRGRGEEVSQKQ